MSAPMTPDREQEIRAREQAATPGPWMREDDQHRLERFVTNESGTLDINFGYLGNNNQANVAFVVDARSAVPELLAEVARLRARVAELETFANGCDGEGCVLPHSSWCERAKKSAAENDGCTCPKPWPNSPQPHAGYCWLVSPPRNEVDEMRKRLAEDPHDGPLHHTYALGRDLPEVTPSPAAKCRCAEPGADPYACEADDCSFPFSELNPFGSGARPVNVASAEVSRKCSTCGWTTSVWHVDDGSAEAELHDHTTRAHQQAVTS